MAIIFHPHAKERMLERGAKEDEVLQAAQRGERFPAKFGRIGYRRNFIFGGRWKNKIYATKQVEVYGVEENEDFVVITVIVNFF